MAKKISSVGKNPMKALKSAHTANTQKGMGDYYGKAVKNKTAIEKSSYMIPSMKTTSKKPPKKLA